MADKDPLDDLQEDLSDAEKDLEKDISDSTDNSSNNSQDTTDNSSSNDNDSSNDGGDNNSGGNDDGADNGGNSGSENEDEFFESEVGVSQAYAPKNKAKKPGKSFGGGGGGKAPDRGKWKSPGGGGKNIMEVVYNEFIAKFIDWIIKKMVDIPLDFLDYVLFDAYKSVAGYTEPEKVNQGKKSILGHGADIEKRHKGMASRAAELHSKAFKEVIDNIERNKSGETLEWKVWRGGEPSFFRHLVDIEEKARTNPNSPEAKMWEKVLKTPDVFVGLMNNEIQYRTLATRLATFEELLNGDNFKLPDDIAKPLKAMEKIIEKGDKPNEIKEKMRGEIANLRQAATGNDFVSQAISQKLRIMDALIADPNADKRKLIGGLTMLVRDMEDVNPVTERIEQKAEAYYETIRHGVDKIREAYPRVEDTERRQELTTQYIDSITESVNKAQKSASKYQETGRLMKATKNITSSMAEKMHINLRAGQQSVQSGIDAIKDSINNFEVDGVRISDRPSVAEDRRRSTPPMERTVILASLSNRLGRR